MQGNSYIVRWLRDGAVVTEDGFGSLEDAKRHAMEQIRLYRVLEIANSALVCDELGIEYMRVF
jgi:hypothetical protein